MVSFTITHAIQIKHFQGSELSYQRCKKSRLATLQNISQAYLGSLERLLSQKLWVDCQKNTGTTESLPVNPEMK
jgi:hypothetical protein